MPDFKPAYGYDERTGEYTGVIKAWRSPADKEEIYLLPANATFDAPPPLSDNQAAVFVDGAWTVQPDFRNQIWYDSETGEPVLIRDFGQPTAQVQVLTPELQANIEAAEIEIAWKTLRAKRDALISATDYVVLPDYPPIQNRDEFLAYRQALRDLPETTVDPRNPVWPPVPVPVLVEQAA